MTHDTWCGLNTLSKFQLSSSNGLGFMMLQISGGIVRYEVAFMKQADQDSSIQRSLGRAVIPTARARRASQAAGGYVTS